MNKPLLLASPAWLAFASLSQSAEPVRLAIVVEHSEAMSAADVLTTELSKSAGAALLERAQVQKVYQEYALAVGGRDYLKLGQIVGADGLLLLSVVKQGNPQLL